MRNVALESLIAILIQYFFRSRKIHQKNVDQFTRLTATQMTDSCVDDFEQSHTVFFEYLTSDFVFLFDRQHWIVRLRVCTALKRRSGLYFFHLQFFDEIFNWNTKFYLHAILIDEYLRYSPIDVDYSGEFHKNIQYIQRENPKASLFRHILWIEWTVVGFFASCWQPLLNWIKNSVWQNFILSCDTLRHLLALFEWFEVRWSYISKMK